MSASPRLSAQTVSAQALSSKQRNTMYALYDCYYENTSAQAFERDLEHKTHVLLLNDEQGRLQGFTSLAVAEMEVQGKQLRYIYSGDTVIHHQYWGEQSLPLAWCELAGSIKSQAPDVPLYWFLIVKGHRTYRYLKIFSRQYFPAPNVTTPPEMQRIIDALAGKHFGEYYNAATGIIHFPTSRGNLRQQWMAVDEGRKEKPEIAFFLQRNPGHGQGDELVCLTELHSDNLRRFALKGFCRGLA